MTDKEISDILEAYQQVYTHQEEVEQLDELKAATDKNVAKLLAKRDREDKDSGGISRGFMARRRAHQSAERRNQRTGSNVKVDPILSRPSYDPRQARLNMEMEYDAFDAILEHLVAEGYADTNQAALVIMANMSEEWRESIIEEVLDERNRGEQGMSDREVTRRRNLGGNVRSRVSASSLGDHGPQSAIQKFHKTKANQRRAIHKSGRYTRGDTGESGGQGRYQANKDHTDGYPSITKRGDGPY